MAILPVDLQALLLRLSDANRPHQRESEGAVLTQMAKAEEVARQAQVESSRVNMVKPHPDLNNKIEPDGRGKQRSSGDQSSRGSRSGTKKQPPEKPEGERSGIEHPYMGKIIDTKV
jgi:hypothetical protein